MIIQILNLIKKKSGYMEGNNVINRKVIILEDINFLWVDVEIEKVIKLWNRGTGIKDISKAIKKRW